MPDESDRLDAALSDRYTIERELGEGGMATVYLATDLKHEREVAIKVLRPELAAVVGAERFLAEIKTTANLKHPHILPLFDSGEADGFLYYVMPYVEGESLRDRLDREKQLPVDEAVRIARAVAAALDHAHRQGVIHRDIKPANILLQDGEPVVADFGIALAVSHAGGGRITETGLSLGTPYYMSPEQATADRDPGPRSDVYSLACVLYEMVAGDPPHTGSSAQAVLARILTDRPRTLTELRETVPPNVVAAVDRALAKVPADRFRSAKEFAEALADPTFTYVPVRRAAPDTETGSAAGPAGASRDGRRVAWPVTAAAAALTALGGVWLGLQLGSGGAGPGTRAVFELSVDTTVRPFQNCCGASEAVAPDGSMLAFLGTSEGTARIWVRALDQLEPRPVRGSEDGRHPVFSPDGTWLAFNTATDLLKVPVEGGEPMTVAGGVGTLRGITWLADNTIVFGTAADEGDGLFRVSADGGTPEPVSAADSTAGERDHRYPHALPDGSTVLVTVMPRDDSQVPRIDVLDLESGERRAVARGSQAAYTDDGHLVFARPDGSLMAQRFDVARLDTIGGPFRIAEKVLYWAPEGVSEFGISRGGTLFAVYGIGDSSDRLMIVGRDGSEEALPMEGLLRYPRFSPDGRFLTVEMVGDGSGAGTDDVWIWDLDQANASRVTVEGDNSRPSWEPDGEAVLFEREAEGRPAGLYRKRIDGTAPAELVQEGPVQTAVRSPDGAWLVWSEGGNLLARPSDDSGEPRELLAESYAELSPVLSPDGRWLAYVSRVSGGDEVYARSFPDMGPVAKLSVEGGFEPRWHPEGSSILFRTRTRELVEVAVTDDGDRLVPGRRTVLRDDSGFLRHVVGANWDIHPDGQRFVFVAAGVTRLPAVTLNATARASGR